MTSLVPTALVLCKPIHLNVPTLNIVVRGHMEVKTSTFTNLCIKFSEKAELTTSIQYIGALSKSRIPICNW